MRARILVFVLIPAAVAIAAGMALLGRGGPEGADATDAALVALGQRVYAEHCAACHGTDLKGEADWRRRRPDGTLPPPPHDASGHTWHHPDAQLFDYTKEGGAGVAPPGFKSGMPGFAGSLTDGEIWAALAFIKSRWPPNIRARQARLNDAAR